MNESPPLLTMTDRAKEHLVALLQNAPDGVQGVRIGVSSRGCNGLRYCLDYLESPEATDQPLTGTDLPVFIDTKSLLFLIGSEMDWQEESFHSGFVFKNPNETSRCGCGESFSVEEQAET